MNRVARFSFSTLFVVTSFLFLTTSFSSSTSLAASKKSSTACGAQLRAILDGDKVFLKLTPRIAALAEEAMEHYKSEVQARAFDPEFPAYINEVFEYRTVSGSGAETVGYKVVITDGGDESQVDYYLDADAKMVSAYWHNQSPLRFWFCK